MIRFGKIRKYDTSNWDGVNSTIFFSGCGFKCPGCFNEELQDFNYGQKFDGYAEDIFIGYANDPHVDGICLLGGEVFHQQLDEMFEIIWRIRHNVNKPIHVWTGSLWEDLIKDEKAKKILHLIDTLVDGPYVESCKDLSLKFRGSSNQRVIDVQKSLKSGRVVEIDV